MGTGMMRNDSDAFVGGDARRGSALVIVIGTLALISVFAAVYISIGQADRRTATTVRIQADQDDITDVHASYIAGVIGDDRLAVYAQTADPTQTPPRQFVRREVTDAPYTDWTVRSQSNFLYALGNPVGEHPVQTELDAVEDFRVPYDPWLASTRPTYLGRDQAPGDRPFSAEFSAATVGSKDYLDKRDWFQISNLAPDLRFVNLFNLRPHGANGRAAPIGGFNSEPGWGETNIDGRRIRRMSEGLSLLEVRGDFALQAFDPVPQNQAWLPGQTGPVALVFPDGASVRDVPAVWTMYQRFMFMPMDQPFIIYNRDGNVSTWGDPDYPAYQYADADGDGMADSRWIELTRAQTPNTGSNPRDDIERLYDAKDMRVFAGIRVMDLSALVNINTATDQLAAPTLNEPLGSTPAEIDLRRLLSMQDAAEEYSGAPFAARAPLSLANIHRPSFYRGTGGNSQQQILQRTEADYARYTHFDVTPLLLQTDSNAMRIGRAASAAIGEAIRTQSDLSGRNEYASAGQTVWVPQTGFVLSEGSRFVDGMDPDAEQRLEYYRSIGGIDSSRIGRAGVIGLDPTLVGTDRGGAGLFDTEDLAELLTYHGLNDPDMTSRLERVVAGRYDDGSGEGRLSPLLSNRPLSLDRTRHGQARDAANSNPNRPRPVDGRVAVESMAMFELTPRARMTTLSGHVPLRPGAYTAPIQNAATPVDRAGLLGLEEAQAFDAAPEAFFTALAGELLSFRDKTLYGGAGIIDQIWEPNVSLNGNGLFSKLFYGYRGPELAMRVAAHAGVNAADAADGDNTISVTTVLLDHAASDELKQISDALDSGSFNPASGTSAAQLAAMFPGAANRELLDPDQFITVAADEVLPTNRLGDGREAVNVYGVEAVPIITEVATMFVYTDAPTTVAGDGDGASSSPSNNPFQAPIGPGTPVTIDGTVAEGNSDFVMQVLAVQLTNPFDVEIQLGGAAEVMGRRYDMEPSSNLQFDYYIEYNGRYFKLGEFQEFNPAGGIDYSADGGPAPDRIMAPGDFEEFQYQGASLGPRQSRVFYATSHPRLLRGDEVLASGTGLDADWARIMAAYSELPLQFVGDPIFDPDGDGVGLGFDNSDWTGPAREWLDAQLSVGGNVPMRIHPFDPASGELVEENTFIDLLLPATGAGDVFPARAKKNDQVRLWRKHINTSFEEVEPPATVGTERNVVENDILIDRMFTGADFLDVRMDAMNMDVEDSVGYREDFSPTNSCSGTGNDFRNENTGLSLVRFASVRRRDPPNGFGGTVEGAVEAWMLQDRANPSETWIRTTNDATKSDAHVDAFPSDSLDVALWFDACSSGADLGESSTRVTEGSERDTEYSLFRLFNRTRANQSAGQLDSRRIVHTIGRNPSTKNDGRFPAAGNILERFPRRQLEDAMHGLDLDPSQADQLRPVIGVGRLGSVDRIGDALLAMGIGPTYAPALTDDPADPTDESWMTLTEALAVGLGFVDPLPNTVAADTVWNGSFLAEEDRVLTDLNLRIDSYIAHFDLDASGDLNPAFDVVRGTGVPMALGVIDQLRAIDPVTLPREEAEGDFDRLTQAIFGTVNINTAPLEVLRLLPGLTPSTQRYFDPSGVERDEWWGGSASLGVAQLTTSQPDEHPDVAAGLQAYRDRVLADPRNRSERVDPTIPPSGILLNLAPDYSLSASETFALVRNMVSEDASAAAYPEQRGKFSGVDGSRGTPGFGSSGEVLVASVDPGNSTYAGFEQLGMQYYGTDGKNLGETGGVTINPLGEFGTSANGVDDDYAERLAIASGILNTVSVRSDYYAVWFVIQGYRESDLVGLLPDDPLVPSLKKRFVMVVDRTNVVNPGDEPRIVLMREVPL